MIHYKQLGETMINKILEALITLICLAPFAIAIYATIIIAVTGLLNPPTDK
jgi:hypothetical protein